MGRQLVLVVDDSVTVCRIIEASLGREDYEVQCCASAEQAIDWLKSPGARMPDLVLVDLILPKMDGYDLIRVLRSLPAFNQIPFLMMSRKSGLIDILRAKLIGAKEYLIKPITVESLLAVMGKYLRSYVPVHSF